MLERAYEYLRATPPFNGWRLPHTDDVEFQVSAHPKEWGSYEFDLQGKDFHRITISNRYCGQTQSLIETMAHEMCHLKQRDSERRSKPYVSHGPKFKRLAAAVCRQHGFDPKTF